MMLRTLIMLLVAASVAACATDEVATGADYQAVVKPPVFIADAAPAPCGNVYGYRIEESAETLPAPIERCIPRWPQAVMDADIMGSCMTVFTLAPDGRPQVESTRCNVADADTPAWRAYAVSAFEKAAGEGIARTLFRAEDASAWAGKRFAINTQFVFLEDGFEHRAPPAPAIPTDVVQLLTPKPQS